MASQEQIEGLRHYIQSGAIRRAVITRLNGEQVTEYFADRFARSYLQNMSVGISDVCPKQLEAENRDVKTYGSMIEQNSLVMKFGEEVAADLLKAVQDMPVKAPEPNATPAKNR